MDRVITVLLILLGSVMAVLFYVLLKTLVPVTTLDEYANNRTRALMEEVDVLHISCTDTRGLYHVLACSVNADVKGTWVIYEYVDGEVRGGSPSSYAFNAWEVRVGSDVSEDIIVLFYPLGEIAPIRLIYKMDTSYMRQGIRNFAGVAIV